MNIIKKTIVEIVNAVYENARLFVADNQKPEVVTRKMRRTAGRMWTCHNLLCKMGIF